MVHTLTAGDTSMTWEQTAEVLAREVDRLQKENDRIRDMVKVIYDNETNDTVWDALESLLSPAAEGGGAANGGESQALQAAILGLHTLAGEFPTAMFETRKDYLQATISEINEILGKQ